MAIPEIRDPAALIRLAYQGGDLAGVIAEREAALGANTLDPAPWMDMSLLYQLAQHRDHALACQARAVQLSPLFKVRPAGAVTLRLLVFSALGDLTTNTPVDLLLEGGGVEVIRLFVQPGSALPESLPEHDVAFVAVGEAPHTLGVLATLRQWLPFWPRPVLNNPDGIESLARDALFRKLQGVPGVAAPPTWRSTAAQLRVEGPAQLPLIVRPLDSHAGRGLDRVQTAAELDTYLNWWGEGPFYASPYVDYASMDGRYRKYRVLFFDGVAHLCHLAIGDQWMVHYLNAGMAEDAAKRDEEAAAMAGFQKGFAARHAVAFAALTKRLGLDYMMLDCAETPDGRLLVFEASIIGIVHALESEAEYPYKAPHMRRVFAAFQTWLRCVAQRKLAKAAPDLISV